MWRVSPPRPLGPEIGPKPIGRGSPHRASDRRRSGGVAIAQSESRHLERLRDDPSSDARWLDEARRGGGGGGSTNSRQDEMVRAVLRPPCVRVSTVSIRTQCGLCLSLIHI